MSAPSILLVDDEVEFTAFLAKLLRRRGFDVEVASSGEAALELARNKPFDAALLDVKMAGMDGLQVLAELRRVSPRTRVIMLTGHLSPTEEQSGLATGAFAYLLKPHPVDALIQHIAAAARSGQQTSGSPDER